MGKPHPIELRERVVAFVNEGIVTVKPLGISGFRLGSSTAW